MALVNWLILINMVLILVSQIAIVILNRRIRNAEKTVIRSVCRAHANVLERLMQYENIDPIIDQWNAIPDTPKINKSTHKHLN